MKHRRSMLKSKLQRPHLSSGYIERPRLIQLFEDNKTKSIVLVCAPAGYGKSVQVSQWLQHQRQSFAWLSLDKYQNDPSSFLQYLVEAIASNFPECLSETKKFLYDPEFLLRPKLTEIFLNELSDLKKPLILVFDDYHAINNPLIHQFVNSLLLSSSPTLRIILVTRKDPPIQLYKLRLYGKILDVRMKELALDAQEFASLSKLSGRNFTHDELQSLLSWTEGWLLGARLLLAKVTTKSQEINRLSSSLFSTDIGQYLEDIMMGFDKDVRSLIKDVAICHRFNADVIDALALAQGKDSIKGNAFINLLIKNQFFLIHLDEVNGWCRFHHLFQDWLVNEISDRSIEHVRTIQSVISKWFAEQGYLDEAVQYASEANNFDLASEIISEYRFKFLDDDRWWEIKRSLGFIPASIRATKIDLLLAELSVSEHTWINVDVPAILEILNNEITNNSKVKHRAEYLYHLGHYNVFALQDAGNAIALLELSKDLLPDNNMFGAHRELSLALARHMDGKTERALVALDEISKSSPAGSLTSLRSNLPRILVLLLAGKFQIALSSSKKFNYVTKNCGLESIEAFSFYCLSNASFQLYSDADLKSVFQKTISFHGKLNYRAHFDANAGWILFQSLRGDHQGALNSLDQLELLASRLHSDAAKENFTSVKARLQWQQGNAHTYVEWAAERYTIGPDTYFFLMDVPAITRCRILFTYGNKHQIKLSLKQLDDIERKLKQIFNAYYEVDIMLLKALANYRLGKIEDARCYLNKGIKKAESNEAWRPIVEMKMAFPELFELSDQQPIALIANASTFNNSSLSGEHVNSGILTLREKEIALMISHGMRNKEIAEELNIALVTVKSHISHIYEKLEVPNRTSMVQKAKELKLIF